MRVEIKEADRSCNGCGSRETVAEVEIINEKSSGCNCISAALCRACRKKLEIELLKYKVAERAKG